jgi:hypothetical protein
MSNYRDVFTANDQAAAYGAGGKSINPEISEPEVIEDAVVQAEVAAPAPEVEVIEEAVDSL